MDATTVDPPSAYRKTLHCYLQKAATNSQRESGPSSSSGSAQHTGSSSFTVKRRPHTKKVGRPHKNLVAINLGQDVLKIIKMPSAKKENTRRDESINAQGNNNFLVNCTVSLVSLLILHFIDTRSSKPIGQLYLHSQKANIACYRRYHGASSWAFRCASQ